MRFDGPRLRAQCSEEEWKEPAATSCSYAFEDQALVLSTTRAMSNTQTSVPGVPIDAGALQLSSERAARMPTLFPARAEPCGPGAYAWQGYRIAVGSPSRVAVMTACQEDGTQHPV